VAGQRAATHDLLLPELPGVADRGRRRRCQARPESRRLLAPPSFPPSVASYHRGLMCEQYVARAAAPFRIDMLWPFTDRLERNGIASYGWGATWLGEDGALHSYRDPGTFVDDDAGRAEVGAQKTRALLVHLRRPSKMSTIGPADTQPFDDPAGRFS